MTKDKPLKPDQIITRDYFGRYEVHNDPGYDPNGETVDETGLRLWDDNTPKGSYIPRYSADPKAEAAHNYQAALADTLAKKQGKGKRTVNGLPGPVSSEPLTGGIGGGEVNWRIAFAVMGIVLALLFIICRNTGGW